jgi:cell division protein FtsZ
MEGTRRRTVAEQGLAALLGCADSLVLIPSDQLPRENVPANKAFYNADLAICRCLRSVCDLLLMPGIVNVDLEDVKQVLLGPGIGRVGIGVGSGEAAAQVAANAAIDNLLLGGAKLAEARSVLVSVMGGKSMSLASLSEAATTIQRAANDDTVLVYGNVQDDSAADDDCVVTLIAMGAHSV